MLSQYRSYTIYKMLKSIYFKYLLMYMSPVRLQVPQSQGPNLFMFQNQNSSTQQKFNYCLMKEHAQEVGMLVSLMKNRNQCKDRIRGLRKGFFYQHVGYPIEIRFKEVMKWKIDWAEFQSTGETTASRSGVENSSTGIPTFYNFQKMPHALPFPHLSFWYFIVTITYACLKHRSNVKFL